MIRVLIAEDHHLVRQGIRALLEKSSDIQVIGEAQDGQEAVEQALQLKPDVIIMDLSMPRLNGTQATEKIRAAHLPSQVVILSMYSDDTLVRQALRSGAKGYRAAAWTVQSCRGWYWATLPAFSFPAMVDGMTRGCSPFRSITTVFDLRISLPVQLAGHQRRGQWACASWRSARTRRRSFETACASAMPGNSRCS